MGSGRNQVSADSGFFTQENVKGMEERGIDAYVPDSHLAHELNRGRRVRAHGAARDPAQQRMRRKLRSPAGRAIVPKTEGNRGTQDRNLERATRDAAVPDARTGQGGDRVHASEHGVESDPPVAQSSGAGWCGVGSGRASGNTVGRANSDPIALTCQRAKNVDISAVRADLQGLNRHRLSCALKRIPSALLLLRRIFVDGFFDHVVELALDFGGVAFFLGGDGAPDERARGGIAQIDDQRSFGIRHPT